MVITERRLPRVNGFLLAFLVLAVACAFLLPSFATPLNLFTLATSASSLLLLSTAACITILAARIDISIGSTMFLAGGSFVVLQEAGLGLAPALGIALASGTVIGAANGALIAFGGLSALLTTLGSMLIVRGIGLQVIGGQQHNLNADTEALRAVELAGLPIYVLFAVTVALGAQAVLSRTMTGRRLIAIGTSDASAAKIGIPVRRYVFVTYALAGLLAAMAGVVSVLNLGGVQTYLGKGQEFVAIAAVVIGGVSLFGGLGSIVPGVLVGVLFLVVVENALNLAGVSPFAFPFVTGAAILVAMYAFSLTGRPQT